MRVLRTSRRKEIRNFDAQRPRDGGQGVGGDIGQTPFQLRQKSDGKMGGLADIFQCQVVLQTQFFDLLADRLVHGLSLALLPDS